MLNDEYNLLIDKINDEQENLNELIEEEQKKLSTIEDQDTDELSENEQSLLSPNKVTESIEEEDKLTKINEIREEDTG